MLGPAFEPGVAALLSLAGITTAVLAGLGLAAFVRRRSHSYLFIALALVAMFVRAGVGMTAMLGYLDVSTHHLLEHGLDTVMAALVIGAVYYARTIETSTQELSATNAND